MHPCQIEIKTRNFFKVFFDTKRFVTRVCIAMDTGLLRTSVHKTSSLEIFLDTQIHVMDFWHCFKYFDLELDRYILDHNSQTVTFCDDYASLTTRDQEQENFFQFSLVPSDLKDFILPTGYPGKQ